MTRYSSASPRATVLVAVAASLFACRSIPSGLDRPDPSYSVAPASVGPLAELSAARDSASEPGESSFLLLELPGEALDWRLALVDSAQQSLELQYYIWHGDDSGGLLITRIWKAAERGVSVRLLLDDFNMGGNDQSLSALDDHPNIEVRSFNPTRNRVVGRSTEFLFRLGELNHRMHNKILVADGLAVVSGGRNIGDEYFGLSDEFNFSDLDLLAVGPVVTDIQGMFDHYWNSDWIVPASALARASVDDVARIAEPGYRRLEQSPHRARFPLAPADWSDRLEQVADRMLPGRAEVVYDRVDGAVPTSDAAFGLQRFLGHAESEALIINAYLIPNAASIQRVGELTAAGVRVGILTNSLGSSDSPAVNSAYSKTRRPLLEAGAELYELRFEGGARALASTPPIRSKWVGLHTKAAVVDRRRVFVGSFNFDPRSESLNTEMGILVTSEELGRELALLIERDLDPKNAWRLQLDGEGEIAWESEAGVLANQPARDSWQRFGSGILGLLPIEDQL